MVSINDRKETSAVEEAESHGGGSIHVRVARLRLLGTAVEEDSPRDAHGSTMHPVMVKEKYD